MQTHKSSCLAGPKARIRAWWFSQDRSPLPEVLPPSFESAPEEPEFRADLVARVRRQIAAGNYGTEEQWDIALERLMRHLDQMG
jgi:hypothetical protein